MSPTPSPSASPTPLLSCRSSSPSHTPTVSNRLVASLLHSHKPKFILAEPVITHARHACGQVISLLVCRTVTPYWHPYEFTGLYISTSAVIWLLRFAPPLFHCSPQSRLSVCGLYKAYRCNNGFPGMSLSETHLSSALLYCSHAQ